MRVHCSAWVFGLLLPLSGLAQDVSPAVPLWAKGAPGFEARRDEPERAQSYWVKNIHNPSITPVLPANDKANGAAVVICPGGGHRELVFKAEGIEPAQFLSNLGVAAFVLKYRLGREEGTPYKIDQHGKEDGQRTIRLVRSRAKEWNVDPERIGIMGFSAGGEIVSMVAYGNSDSDPNSVDPIDRVSCRPNFQIMIYPGPLGIPDVVPAGSPPAFLLVANDDRGAARNITSLLGKLRDARVPVEAHVLASGGHGFNMGNRSKLASVRSWPQRLADWMSDTNLLKPSANDAGTAAK